MGSDRPASGVEHMANIERGRNFIVGPTEKLLAVDARLSGAFDSPTIHQRAEQTNELAKQLQRSLGWFWGRAERKLYDEPKRLVAAGLATATVEHTGTRPRTVYAITSDGRAAVRNWLGESSTPPTLEFEAMVRVFFADGGALEQLRSTLAGVEAGAVERLSVLRTMMDAVDSQQNEFAVRRPINALGLRFHLNYEQLQIDWARWALNETARWNSPTDAAGPIRRRRFGRISERGLRLIADGDRRFN